MSNGKRVLVCYASAAGSTRGIAERIAARISSASAGDGDVPTVDVVCQPAGPAARPEWFDAVVVGSAVHSMAWLPEATAVLARAAAAGVPVWAFSVGGVEPKGRLTRAAADKERERVAEAFPAGFAPQDHRVFAGIVVMTGVPLWGRAVWRLLGGRPGDHRNWPAVDHWAAGIAAEVVGSPAFR